MYNDFIMIELMLFTDGSVDTLTKIGYGAYLTIPESDLSLSLLEKHVKVRKFEQTSSTKLELQTLLWALNNIQVQGRRVVVYTDSQNIVSLKGRRKRLEQNNYRSKKNKQLNNYELYKKFYAITDQLNCEFKKISGHKVSRKKDSLDKIFSLVDKASRKALRESRDYREGRVLRF